MTLSTQTLKTQWLSLPPTTLLSSSPSISSLAPSHVSQSSSPCLVAHRRPLLDDLSGSQYASRVSLDTKQESLKRTIDPRGSFNLLWLLGQSLIFVYNALTIPLRFAFPQVQRNLLFTWTILDYTGDAVLLCHVLVVAPRVSFMHNGFWVANRRRLWTNYTQNGPFVYDALSLLPLDILCLMLGLDSTLFRLPRLLKVTSALELMRRLDHKSSRPHVLRLTRTLAIMLYLIHLQTCAYYLLSTTLGLGSDSFVYDGQGSAYIRCFYFATRTLTSIGNSRGRFVSTSNSLEMLFMTISWLSGMFVFAVLIGDVRDNVGKFRQQSSKLRRRMDAITDYLVKNKVHEDLRRKVKLWMDHALREERNGFGVNELEIMDNLPMKLKIDLAMRIHFQTVSKVKIFRNCDLGLIKEVVVALRPTLFLPGEHVCRRGEVGSEMFIVQSGKLHVMGGLDGSTVLCPLGEGAVFGEIALLGVDGLRRRTADVVAVGFATLLVLHKHNLDAILSDYPEANSLLRERAKRFLRQNERLLNRQRAQRDRALRAERNDHYYDVDKENNKEEEEMGDCSHQRAPLIPMEIGGSRIHEGDTLHTLEDESEDELKVLRMLEHLPFITSPTASCISSASSISSSASSLGLNAFTEDRISFVGDSFFI